MMLPATARLYAPAADAMADAAPMRWLIDGALRHFRYAAPPARAAYAAILRCYAIA